MERSQAAGDARRTLLVVGVGVALGVATLGGQSVLPDDWNRLANSGAIWLLVAFLLGSRMPTGRWAALAGMVSLVGALVGYYAAARIAGAGVSTSAMAIWIGTALIGGPVYGVAGWWWRWGVAPRRILAIGLAGGIVVAEGIFTLLRIPDLSTVGWVEVVAGVVLVILLGRSIRERLLGLAILPVVVLAGAAAYEIIDRVIASR